MTKPTGKLKYAYNTIMNMEAKIKQLEAEIKELKQPNLYWLVGNPESGSDSLEGLLEEFIDDTSIGEIFELEVAHRLPNIKVRILPDDDDGHIQFE